jgi:lipopolysaccharide transport system permease protein
MALQIATITLVFGMLFKNPLQDYLPFVATSIIFWGFISNSLNEGCLSFIVGEGIIKQLNLPVLMHTFRTVWKNILAMAHNLAILPLAFLVVQKPLTWSIFWILPGLILLIINVTWMMVILAFLSTRYRDVQPIVASILMILVNVTPVFWYPKTIGNADLAHLLIGLNPFYHLLQVIRLPLLGSLPTLENWLVCVGLGLLGSAAALIVVRKFGRKIAYWV